MVKIHVPVPGIHTKNQYRYCAAGAAIFWWGEPDPPEVGPFLSAAGVGMTFYSPYEVFETTVLTKTFLSRKSELEPTGVRKPRAGDDWILLVFLVLPTIRSEADWSSVQASEMLRVIQLNTLEDRSVHDKNHWDGAIRSAVLNNLTFIPTLVGLAFSTVAL